MSGRRRKAIVDVLADEAVDRAKAEYERENTGFVWSALSDEEQEKYIAKHGRVIGAELLAIINVAKGAT